MELTTGGLNLVLLGRTGAGKSASGNTILGRPAFTSKKSFRSITQDVAVESGTVDGFPVTVYDTPGLFDTELSDDEIEQMINEKVLQRCESGLCVFLLVIKADRFTEEERKTVEKIEKLLGEKHIDKTWIFFTRGDELEDENMTIKEFIDETEPLKRLVQKYDQRYHVFNNKKRGHTKQVIMLLTKILKPYLDTIEGAETQKPNPLMRIKPDNTEPDTPFSSPSSRRIVLLGKTGVGKSAAGNTILGQRKFDSVMRMNAVTSESSVKHATVSGRSVSVVDTPGLFDTQMDPVELVTEIARSVYLSSPGPHAFLIVFPVNNRFTDQELQIPQIIEMLFGEEVLKYSIILFTHGDLLRGKSVEKLIQESCRLRDVVDQCGGRFHVFNNGDVNNRDQVNDLLKKIDTMIEQNGRGHYSNEMYEDAQRFRREEEERKQREEKMRERDEEERKKQEEKHRQDNEKRRQDEIERVRKETDVRMRAKFEALLKSEQERLQRQREDDEIKQQEKQRRDENEREINDIWDRIRAKMEVEVNKTPKEEDTGFVNFFSNYWCSILTAAALGGLVVGGVGALAGALAGGKVGALVGALAGGGVGALVGGGVGSIVCYCVKKHKEEKQRQYEEKMRQAEIEKMKEEIETIRADMKAQLKSEQERLVARQREDEERKQQEKQRLDEIERGIKEIGI